MLIKIKKIYFFNALSFSEFLLFFVLGMYGVGGGLGKDAFFGLTTS